MIQDDTNLSEASSNYNNMVICTNYGTDGIISLKQITVATINNLMNNKTFGYMDSLNEEDSILGP